MDRYTIIFNHYGSNQEESLSVLASGFGDAMEQFLKTPFSPSGIPLYYNKDCIKTIICHKYFKV